MSGLPLEHNKKYYTDFNLPKSNKKFYGHIIIDKGVIKGELLNLPDVFVGGDGHVLDVLMKGSKDFLINCRIRVSDKEDLQANIIGFRITKYRLGNVQNIAFNASYLVFGHAIKNVEFEFKHAIICLNGLRYWFPTSFNKGDNTNVLLFEDIKVRWYLEEWVRSQSNSIPQGIKSTEYKESCIGIDFKGNTGLEFVDQQANLIQSFFCLLWFRMVPIEYFRTFDLNDNALIWYKSDYRNYPSTLPNRGNIVLHFESIKVENSAENYMKISDMESELIAMYLETASNLNLSHISFKEYVNILERMSNQDSFVEIWSEKVKYHLDKIKDRPIQYQFFQSQFRKRKTPSSLKDKLDSVLEEDLLGLFQIGDKSLFVRILSDSRNWYTHPSGEKSKFVIPRDNIRLFTEALRIIVNAKLLMMLEVDLNVISENIKKRNLNFPLEIGFVK